MPRIDPPEIWMPTVSSPIKRFIYQKNMSDRSQPIRSIRLQYPVIYRTKSSNLSKQSSECITKTTLLNTVLM